MKETLLRQEIRKMKFENWYIQWEKKQLNLSEVAEALGVCERTVRRYIESYEEEGLEGLNDKRLSKAAHNAAPLDEVLALTNLYESSYKGYSAAHFYDCYRKDHKGGRSYNWVRNTLTQSGSRKAVKPGIKHRRKRPRSPMTGMKIHQDASTHQWIEDVYWDLVVTMDDANNEIYSMFFVEEEGTWRSFRGVQEVIEKKGLFCVLYTDRGSHYWHTDTAHGKVSKERLTQFGRAMKTLDIRMIAAYSPQARGRSERMFRTLQNRLPQELKSHGITDIDSANAYLKNVFLPAFNERFKIQPEQLQTAFVPWNQGSERLRDILCLQSDRQVNKDSTISYKGSSWQISRSSLKFCPIKARIKVCEYQDGSIAIYYGPRKLTCELADLPQKEEDASLTCLIDLAFSPSPVKVQSDKPIAHANLDRASLKGKELLMQVS